MTSFVKILNFGEFFKMPVVFDRLGTNGLTLIVGVRYFSSAVGSAMTHVIACLGSLSANGSKLPFHSDSFSQNSDTIL